MLYDSIYDAFPSQSGCLKHLENFFWEGKPECPYCKSHKQSEIPGDRYKCNNCNRSYRVTVNTLFHNTKCDIQRWFLAIITFRENKNVSARGLARRIRVNKNSAFHIQKILQQAYAKKPALFKLLADSLNDKINIVEFEKWTESKDINH